MRNADGVGSFHRTVAGLCLILAPLVLAIAQPINPGEGDAGWVQAMADMPGRIQAASLLVILSSLLFVPALIGLLRLVRQRGSVLGHVGVGLMLIGVIGHAVWAGFEIVLVWMATSEIDRAQLSAVVNDGAPSSIGFTVVLLMFLAGFFLGAIVLAAGLWRSGAVPRWAAACIAAFPLSEFIPIGNESIQESVFMIGLTLMVIGFGAIGLKLLKGQELEHAPSAGEAGVGAQLQA